MGGERDPRERFSGRAGYYARFRPRYPDAVVSLLRAEVGLTPSWRVADLGSGTGLSAEPFLRNGNTLFGVEPNAEMRRVAEANLSRFERFHSVAGSAEATTLPGSSVDLAIAGQAFHWFDVPVARRECARILAPGGIAVLLWNARRTGATPFLRAYEALVERHGTDYLAVRDRHAHPASLESFFARGRYLERRLDNEQLLDLEGLVGRLLSSSYLPAAGQPGHAPMLDEAARIFDEHQEGGRVRFEYDTELFIGRVQD